MPFLTAQESKVQNNFRYHVNLPLSSQDAEYQMQHVKYLPSRDSEVYLEISGPHLLSFHSCKYIVIHRMTGREIFTCIKFLL